MGRDDQKCKRFSEKLRPVTAENATNTLAATATSPATILTTTQTGDSMKIKVYLTGDSDLNALRLVDVPADELEGVKPYENEADLATFLESVFTYGQNDFQRVPGVRSLMVGDLIEFNGSYHVIQSFSFKKLTEAEMDEFMAMKPEDRRWSRLCGRGF